MRTDACSMIDPCDVLLKQTSQRSLGCTLCYRCYDPAGGQDVREAPPPQRPRLLLLYTSCLSLPSPLARSSSQVLQQLEEEARQMRRRGYASELVRRLREEEAWELKVKHLAVIHHLASSPPALASRYRVSCFSPFLLSSPFLPLSHSPTLPLPLSPSPTLFPLSHLDFLTCSSFPHIWQIRCELERAGMVQVCAALRAAADMEVRQEVC